MYRRALIIWKLYSTKKWSKNIQSEHKTLRSKGSDNGNGNVYGALGSQALSCYLHTCLYSVLWRAPGGEPQSNSLFAAGRRGSEGLWNSPHYTNRAKIWAHLGLWSHYPLHYLNTHKKWAYFEKLSLTVKEMQRWEVRPLQTECKVSKDQRRESLVSWGWGRAAAQGRGGRWVWKCRRADRVTNQTFPQ